MSDYVSPDQAAMAIMQDMIRDFKVVRREVLGHVERDGAINEGFLRDALSRMEERYNLIKDAGFKGTKRQWEELYLGRRAAVDKAVAKLSQINPQITELKHALDGFIPLVERTPLPKGKGKKTQIPQEPETTRSNEETPGSNLDLDEDEEGLEEEEAIELSKEGEASRSHENPETSGGGAHAPRDEIGTDDPLEGPSGMTQARSTLDRTKEQLVKALARQPAGQGSAKGDTQGQRVEAPPEGGVLPPPAPQSRASSRGSTTTLVSGVPTRSARSGGSRGRDTPAPFASELEEQAMPPPLALLLLLPAQE